jgi:hypothetical protein
MMAAIVVPLGSWSIFRTVACFDEARAAPFEVAPFAPVLLAAARFDWDDGLFFAICFAARDDLRDEFADFDFDLLVAI